MECIILAGGLGTRLRSVVSDLPKCMAQVASRPFVAYLVDALTLAGFDHIVFSLGYKSEDFLRWIGSLSTTAHVEAVVESVPLGTGGAVKFASQAIRGETFFVLNGDSFLTLDYAAMLSAHRENISRGALATLALRRMADTGRYGTVTVDDSRITAFCEKQPGNDGLINAGVYVLQREALEGLPGKFSIEKDFFEPQVSSGRLFGFQTDGYFIDIGIPEDYARAQDDFAAGRYKLYDTLMLDRDGVIDVELVSDYVKRPEEMIFLPGALDAIAALRPYFARTIVVTNQRGVGRGLMTLDALKQVNSYLHAQVKAHGGHLDKIYYSTGVDESDPLRKPNPGMALQYRSDWPEADFSRSIMVGDKDTDMEFARRAGVRGVMVGESFTLADFAHSLIDSHRIS